MISLKTSDGNVPLITMYALPDRDWRSRPQLTRYADVQVCEFLEQIEFHRDIGLEQSPLELWRD